MSGLVDSEQALLGPMVDPFGRTIRYLRVSVTDRCDLRCFYCMGRVSIRVERSAGSNRDQVDGI